MSLYKINAQFTWLFFKIPRMIMMKNAQKILVSMLFFSDTQQLCSLNVWHCLSWCIRWTGKHTYGGVSYSFLHSPPTVTPLGPVWAMSPFILACPLGSLASSSSGTSVIFSVLDAFSGSSDLAAPFKLTCWRNFSMSSWLTNKEKRFKRIF